MVPLPDVGRGVAELAYLLDVLELDGIVMTSHVAGTYLGDPALEPLYAELHRRAAYVFVHPTIPPGGVPLRHPAWLYEFPFETTRAIANLVYSGTFERHPDIRWQFAHLGGAAPFLAPRIASLAEREPALADRCPGRGVGVLLAPVLRHRTGQQQARVPDDRRSRPPTTSVRDRLAVPGAARCAGRPGARARVPRRRARGDGRRERRHARAAISGLG